ncbi:MAG: serine/threonine-protein kinase [Phormidesmis sp.]
MAYCLNPICPQPQNPSAASFCSACGTPLTLAGRYRLISPLGKGGFGRTFLAEVLPVASATTAQVASKSMPEAVQTAPCVIKQLYESSLAGEAGFQLEAERLRQLGDHPQIPRLLAAIENEWGQFLVQEFAPGDNLAQQLEAGGAWTEPQVRSLLNSLIPVLQHVHSFDIIHRDIKPANIVLKGEPKSQQDQHLDQTLPMLVDFGAAKWIRHTAANTVIGSAGYAAPEQSMGQATFASDIYSLGLTCLNLLTSIHPFLLYSAVEDRWVWRDYLPQSIEPRFAQVLDHMVARSLQQRYESMDQVALDLQFSQNPLVYAPKQLLDRATEAIPSLKRWLGAKKTHTFTRPAVVSAAQDWQRRDRLTHPIGVTQAIAVSPKAPIFATGGTDGALRLWHLPSAQLIHTFQRRRLIGDGHTAPITALQFHPDGRALYSASADGTLKEWDSAERCLLNTLPTSGWTPTDLAINPAGNRLISPNSDGQIVLWDIATLLPAAQLAQHQRRVNAVVCAPAGDLLISASDDGTVKLWRYLQGPPHLAETLALNRKGSGEQRAIALAIQSATPTAHQLIVATTAGKVRLYQVNAQLHLSRPVDFYHSPSPITALALSAEDLLAVGSEDNVLTLWQVETGDCVAQLSHDWGIVVIAFTPDGQTLIVASADEVVSIWQRDV